MYSFIDDLIRLIYKKIKSYKQSKEQENIRKSQNTDSEIKNPDKTELPVQKKAEYTDKNKPQKTAIKETQKQITKEPQSPIAKATSDPAQQKQTDNSALFPDITKLSDESKRRFPEGVLEILLYAGWHEGRKIDVTRQLEYYRKCGFETFDILTQFLEEFDQLDFSYYSYYEHTKKLILDGESCKIYPNQKFDALMPESFKEGTYEKFIAIYKDLADAIKEKCVPIGKDCDYNYIFLSESGKIFIAGNTPEKRLGVTIEEGISRIIHRDLRNSCKLSILNQDMEILSDSEIISTGEYSEDEPDIKTFEVNAIKLCKNTPFKTNHIIYSKHPNGKIKHYYLLTSLIRKNIIDFKYVYKVTFYESGKLKSHYYTEVNREFIYAYEWYEHGEIKATINYYNNEHITYTNFADNGAFISEETEYTKYMSDDIYNQTETEKASKTTADQSKKEIYIPDTDKLSEKSKNRFPEKVLKMLLLAGWHEGRKIDATAQLEYYKECGFETFDILKKFLEEFDKLYFSRYDIYHIDERHKLRGDKYNAKDLSHFDAKKPANLRKYTKTNSNSYQTLCDMLEEKCVPVGQNHDNYTIFLTESGKMYLDGQFPKRLGSTIEEGIHAVMDNDYNSCELRVLNQELDILSDNKITLSGKISGYEPEIKEFEVTVINMGKKNYIMYSKYSNGNIKHYYQYKTLVQRFTEYKYVYKVTFYESGKLKSYTETKVNSPDITTYEWYEHGALKSITACHRNNSVICKNYDENGNFTDRQSKREQYITNAVYLKREADHKPDVYINYRDKAIKTRIIPRGHKYAIDEIPDTSKLSAKNKQRFPKAVLEMLLRVGWYEGRKIDVTEQLKRYEQCGFEIFDILPKFLEEFDKLYFCEYRTFNRYRDAKLNDEYTYDSPTRDYFDAEKAMYIDKKRFDTPEKIKTIVNSVPYTDLAEEIKERFVPIGQAYMNLYLTESGKMYMDIGPLERIGVTIEEGITHLINSTHGGCPAYIINQDLRILSDDEITSKGEYSDSEPDIEVFNNSFAEKRNYIMYSKYSNGNIKHYYQLITQENAFHKYQPVTKVTYYESGKLKSYTHTAIGEKTSSIYEWHENGEIKSITNYGNAGRSHRKFDKNGAFIC